jgi:hypothetical protein
LSNSTDADPYGHAASNLVAGGNLESMIQSILEMGGGAWDQETVTRALQAAFNNPERAVEYLYSVRATILLFYCYCLLFCDEPIFLSGQHTAISACLLNCTKCVRIIVACIMCGSAGLYPV